MRNPTPILPLLLAALFGAVALCPHADAQCPSHWLPGESISGVGGNVSAIATLANGDIIVGGLFPTAGGVLANNIARFNPASGTWSALGEGLLGANGSLVTISALAALPNGDLVAGGTFAFAGGLPASNIAWYHNATDTWTSLSTGTNSAVLALAALSNGDLIVGGQFTTAGDQPVAHIARFHFASGSWSALGAGFNGAVRALAVLPPGRLIAGGSFTPNTGTAINGLGEFDFATENWNPLGLGAPSGVGAIGAFSSENLVIAGASYVARFNPSTNAWEQIGAAGLYSVASLALLPNGDLVATSQDGTKRYDAPTATWVGFPINSYGGGTYAMTTLPNGDLVVGGSFISMGGAPANGIASYNQASDTWSALGTGINYSVRTILPLVNGDMLCGGSFSRIGNVQANYVARYTPATHTWSPLGSGTNSDVFALLQLPGGDIIAGGSFNRAGGVPVNYVARFNPSTNSWSALGGTTGGNVYALALLQDGTLLAGGEQFFRYNLATGVRTNLPSPPETVATLAVLPNGDVLAGYGSPALSAYFSSGGVKRYRPSTNSWSDLGSGTNGRVTSMIALPGGDVVMGGFFTMAGGLPANRIARCKPTSNTWTTLGSGFSGSGVPAYYLQSLTNVTSLALLPNGDLIAAGGFYTAGGTAASNIARYNFATTTWSALDAGLNRPAYAAAVSSTGDVYTGGFFTAAGDNVSAYLARYSTHPACPPDFNCSSTLEVQDIFAFLTAWFNADPAADFNASGVVQVQDIFDFLAAWFTGCA